MQILPKILYYFRSLPIPLPSKFFKQTTTKLKHFIWNGKKTRVAFSILTTTKDLGGMGLPDIRNYHYASLLDQIKLWFTSPNDKLWLNIEKETPIGHDLFTLSMAKHVIPKKVIVPNLLFIKSTLIAWKHILKYIKPKK